MQNVNLTHHFLIAMPHMADASFSRALVYIVEHTADGALGIIVNRPVDMTMLTLFERVNVPLVGPTALMNLPVYFGGPVQTNHGFVLHRPPGAWQASLLINDEMALTSSKDILFALGQNALDGDVLITLGYSGWTAGQLEAELAQNAWLTVEAHPDILFVSPPEERLACALQLLGIDFANLSTLAGHA